MRFHRLDGEQFAQALTAVRPPLVLDIRPLAAFTAGHVPGSLHLPVHDLPRRRSELPSTLVRRLLIVADSPKRAESAANFCVLVGYGDVAILEGGLGAFRGDLETGPPEPPQGRGPVLRITP